MPLTPEKMVVTKAILYHNSYSLYIYYDVLDGSIAKTRTKLSVGGAHSLGVVLTGSSAHKEAKKDMQVIVLANCEVSKLEKSFNYKYNS